MTPSQSHRVVNDYLAGQRGTRQGTGGLAPSYDTASSVTAVSTPTWFPTGTNSSTLSATATTAVAILSKRTTTHANTTEPRCRPSAVFLLSACVLLGPQSPRKGEHRPAARRVLPREEARRCGLGCMPPTCARVILTLRPAPKEARCFLTARGSTRI